MFSQKGQRLNRRQIFVAAIAGGASAMLPRAVCATSTDNEEARLIAIAQRLSRDRLVDSPQSATSQGLDVGVHAVLKHRLNDRSPAVLRRDLARARAAIAVVEAIDPRTLSAESALYREVFLYRERTSIVGPARFGVDSPQHPFVITDRYGAYFTVPDFLDRVHTIRTADDAEAYLDRVRAFAVALDQDSESQATDARRGYLAPAFVLDTALAQIAALRALTGSDSMLTRSIVRRTVDKIPGDWGARCATIVEREVYPALDRQVALVRQLRKDARISAGVWDVPEGEALYAAALEDATTTKVDAAELNRLGLEQIAEIGAQLEPLLVAQGLNRGSVGERLLELSRRPELLYPDTAAGRAELLRNAGDLTEAMRPRLAALFDRPPNNPMQIEPAPAEIEDGASYGNYFPASSDGSVSARFRVNLKALVGLPRYAMPSFIYHEGLPGHHLQYGYARDGMGWRFTAYSEGWALYAEQLADELGAYATPLDRIGYLQSRLFRAARLVVDTGIHARRWSRERATAYLVTETGTPASLSQREVDRYCTQPGQACSYMVGYLSWVRAREAARRLLGTKYDAKTFHGVLRYGALPLPIMERLAEDRARSKA